MNNYILVTASDNVVTAIPSHVAYRLRRAGAIQFVARAWYSKMPASVLVQVQGAFISK